MTATGQYPDAVHSHVTPAVAAQHSTRLTTSREEVALRRAGAFMRSGRRGS